MLGAVNKAGFSKVSLELAEATTAAKMNGMRLGLTVSVTLHAAALGMLVWFANAVPPPLDVPPPKGFEIAMTQPTEQAASGRSRASRRLDTAPPVPPEPEKAVTTTEVPIAREPEVPVVTAHEPPPPPKPQPKPKPPPRPVVRRPEPEPQIANLPPILPSPTPAPQAPAAYAPPAPPAPNPDLAAHYRAMLSGWFESHKRYPNSARDAAEQRATPSSVSASTRPAASSASACRRAPAIPTSTRASTR